MTQKPRTTPPVRIPLDEAIELLLHALRPQKPPPDWMAQRLEDAWSSGQLRVWRDGRLMLRHDMLAYYARITLEADGRGWTCSVEQRPGTLVSAKVLHMRYAEDGGMLVTTGRPRWEFDRAYVEALAPPRKAGPGRRNRHNWPERVRGELARIGPNHAQELENSCALTEYLGVFLQTETGWRPADERRLRRIIREFLMV